MEIQESKWKKVKRFVKETHRVMKITKKPSKQEWMTATKITALGTAVIGAVGFALFIIKQLLFS